MSFGPFRLTVAERLLEKAGVPVALGARALDILTILVGRAGEVVEKRELIALVWPDVVVDEGSLRFHVNGLRKALGDGRDGARYIATIAGRGYCFVAPVARMDGEGSPSVTAGAADPRPVLPSRLARMVGRDEAVLSVAANVAEERFVTVLGAGGIGKTTVAVAVAHQLVEAFEGRVRFVDLGSTADAKLVPSAVASAVGFVAHAADVVPTLIAFLQDKRLLIVLDSCEHVISAAAALAERIFTGAPGVHILCTSREALRVEGEHVHLLPPLASPPGHSDLGSGAVLTFPAVQLFVERATASGARFELTDDDAPAIAEICRNLDGIPLAIELAAGRVSAYGIGGIASLLGDRFSGLANGRRTAIARHQTLGATLDWSYNLLSEAERTLLRRLSVFAGTFSLEAAQAVAGFGAIDEHSVVDGIGNLISKSLIAAEFTGGSSRYRLLDTTRRYTHEKLVECGEAAAAARRHASYYHALLRRIADPETATPEGVGGAQEHIGNVRAALAWCFADGGDENLGVALASAAVPLLVELSLLSECCGWAERALSTLTDATRGTTHEINLQAALGHSLMFTEGNSERVRECLTRGTDLARSLDEPLMELRLLGSLHLFNERTGNYHGAVEFARRSDIVARAIGHPAALAAAGSFVGLSQHLVGNHAEARALLEESLAQNSLSQQSKAIHFGFDYRNRSRITLARHLWLVGEADKAAALAEQTIADAARMRHPVTLCIALIWGITVFLWNGDTDNSENKISSFLDHARKHSLNPYNAVGLGYAGELCVQRGEGEAGVAYLESALATLHAARYELVTTTFMMALAQGMAASGHEAEALAKIEETIALIEANGDLLYLPEAIRIKGAILVGDGVDDGGSAEACYIRALDLARQQSALAWALRTATSFARLRRAQGRSEEAVQILAPVLARFSEGFGTADLLAAKSLIEEMMTGRIGGALQPHSAELKG